MLSLFKNKEAKAASHHAVQRIQSSKMELKPFPHIIVDNIFPDEFYNEILRHLPPVSLLSIPDKFGMMRIGDDDETFRSISKASRQFWSTFDKDVKGPICTALFEQYRPFTEQKLSLIFGQSAPHATAVDQNEIRMLRGIVQCRTSGARMGPHVDKATALFTYLFYFAPDDSLRQFGTIFYDVPDHSKLLEFYRANRGIRAWFPSEDDLSALDLRPMPPLEFLPNRLVSYVNFPYSLHGAATDAAAPRYSMQSFCDLPDRIALPLFAGWRDPISPTGIYRGD